MSILEAFGFPSEASAKASLFKEMRELGAVRLEAHYSGGNDEGGVDSIDVLLDADGKKIEPPANWITRPATKDDDAWSIREGVVHEYHPLFEAVDGMLSTEFGSWAGDFTAYGTFYADLKENKVWRSGEASSYSEDGHEY